MIDRKVNGRFGKESNRFAYLHYAPMQQPHAAALFQCSCNGDLETASSILLQYPHTLSLYDNTGHSNLHYAVKYGHLALVKLYLHSPNVDALSPTSSGLTILHLACIQNNYTMLHMLLPILQRISGPGFGNFIDQDSILGSALLIATTHLNVDIITDLIIFGANILFCGVLGSSPLHEMCQAGMVKIVKLFLCAIDTIEERRKLIDMPNIEGNTCLLLSVEEGSQEILRCLLDSKPNVDYARTMDGATALFMACDEGLVDVVALLVEVGARCDIGSPQTGAFPLFIASQHGYSDVVEILISNLSKDKNRLLVEVNRMCLDGTTSLHIAAEEGHCEIVQMLLECNVDITHCVDSGATPLFVACQNGHKEVVQLLLAHHMDPVVSRYDGASPLFIACTGNHVRYILMK